MTSILGESKLKNVETLCTYVSSLGGSVAELGVYKGGTSRLMKTLLPHKKIFLIDTFEGIPEKSGPDYHDVGSFSDTSLEAVKSLFTPDENVDFVVGFFPESCTPSMNINKFCLVHLDADQYLSTLNGLKYFYPKMVKGGIILLDDWGWKNCPGVKKAAEEFLSTVENIAIQIHEYQAIIIKK